MKHLRGVALAVTAMMLVLSQGSCVIRSVHPWLASSDVAFEPELLGGWVGSDGGKDVAMTFVRGDGNFYFVQYQSGDTRGSFRALLGKVSGEYYLDYRPIDGPPGVDGMLLYPTHSVARLEISAERLVVQQMNYDVVKARAQLERLRGITHAWDEEHELLITSKSDDLRSFLASHSRDNELYVPPVVLLRKK